MQDQCQILQWTKKAIDTPFNGCWAIADCKFCGKFFTSMYSNNALKCFGAFWDSKFFQTQAMICLRTFVKKAVYPSPVLNECRIHLSYYVIHLYVHMNCHGSVQWFHTSTGHFDMRGFSHQAFS